MIFKIFMLTSKLHASAINFSCFAVCNFSFNDFVALDITAAVVYISMAADASLFSMNCSLTTPLPYFIKTISTASPNETISYRNKIIQKQIMCKYMVHIIHTAESLFTVFSKSLWTKWLIEGSELSPTFRTTLLEASSNIKPKLAVGFLNAACNSFKCAPAY